MTIASVDVNRFRVSGRRPRAGWVLALAFALVVSFAPVVADDHEDEGPGPLTWIGLSKLNPGKSAEDALGLFLRDKEFMDGLVADGTILSYGAVTPINHDPGDLWNYAEFVTLESWEKVDAWMAKFFQLRSGMSDDEKKELQAAWRDVHADGSHFDWIMRHTAFEPNGVVPRYLYLAHFNVHPDRADDVADLFNDFVEPALADARDAGKLGAIGLYTHEIHGDHDFTHGFWYAMPGLSGIDAMSGAFGAAAGDAQNAWAESILGSGDHYDKVVLMLHYEGPETRGN